jgi:serine/threonine protein phosphatase 1
VVIGDLHAQYRKLVDLWAVLERRLPDLPARTVVFLGDYLDRGPRARETLDWLVELRRSRPGTLFLCGNHDIALAAFLGLVESDPEANAQWSRAHRAPQELWSGPGCENIHPEGRRWPGIYESEPTFASYGVPHGDRTGLLAALPPDHQAFFLDLPWVVEHPEYLFVHSGFVPDVPLAEQLRFLHARQLTVPRVLQLHARKLQPNPPDVDRVVVSGHFHHPRVRIEPGRIVVDTTGGRTGCLAAVALPERRVVWGRLAEEPKKM